LILINRATKQERVWWKKLGVVSSIQSLAK
jgi:hypothetical protein